MGVFGEYCNQFKYDGLFVIAPDVCVDSRKDGNIYSEIWQCKKNTDSSTYSILYQQFAGAECGGNVTISELYTDNTDGQIICDKTREEDCFVKWRYYIPSINAPRSCKSVNKITDDFVTYPIVIGDCDQGFFEHGSQSLKWNCEQSNIAGELELSVSYWFNNGRCRGGSEYEKEYNFCNSVDKDIQFYYEVLDTSCPDDLGSAQQNSYILTAILSIITAIAIMLK